MVFEFRVLVLECEIVVFEFMILVLECEILVPHCAGRQYLDILKAVVFFNRLVLAVHLGYSFLFRRTQTLQWNTTGV
jgi:hypothetical protein